jgi:hypothetical protein
MKLDRLLAEASSTVIFCKRYAFKSLRLSLLFVSLFVVATVVPTVVFLQQGVSESHLADAPTDRMAAELLRAADRAGICSAANAVGVGLRGEYYSESSLRGRAALVRVDDVVDFESSMKLTTNIEVRPVSVRWSGWVKPPLSGLYRFHAEAPNMRVLVARNLVAGAGVPMDQKVNLSAGRFYPIEVIVSKITHSDTRIRLEWTAPHGARYVIPRALLHLPSETVVPPLGGGFPLDVQIKSGIPGLVDFPPKSGHL